MTLKVSLAKIVGKVFQGVIEPRKQKAIVFGILKHVLLLIHWDKIESPHNEGALFISRLAVVGWRRGIRRWIHRPGRRFRPVRYPLRG